MEWCEETVITHGDYTRQTEILKYRKYTQQLSSYREKCSYEISQRLTSIYRDVVLKICTNRDNRQINLVHFVVNSDEWENIKRCK